MLLCLDIGNTHILGGIYDQSKLITRFRYATNLIGTADQFGIFLNSFLDFEEIHQKSITATAVCSVVPSYDYTIKHSISLYLDSHYFVLQPGVKTGLNIKCKNPNEMGADLIASAIGAADLYPNQNMIVVDMGTATTLCPVTKEKDCLGVTILSGMRLSMESLSTRTAKLMEVDIEAPETYIGRTTRESIKAGLYFGQLGALHEIIKGIKAEAFANEKVLIVATGGFAQLFRDKNIFDVILPDLVLHGLMKAYTYSHSY